MLDHLERNHPAYDAEAGYEIAGFVWFQGFKDQFSPEFRDSYKDNMVSFIKDVREEYKTPHMPFVIGVLGTGMTAEKVAENQVSVAQREAAKLLGSQNGVAAVESYTEYSMRLQEVVQVARAIPRRSATIGGRPTLLNIDRMRQKIAVFGDQSRQHGFIQPTGPEAPVT